MFDAGTPVFSSRHIAAHAATLATTWTDGTGEPSAPTGAVSVVVTDSAGAVVLSTTATVSGSSCSVVLSASLVPAVDWLAAVWTDAAGVTTTTAHEVTGGVYVTLAALRSLEPSLASYSDAEVLEARSVAEAECERITRQSWVRRLGRSTVESHTCWIVLPWTPLVSLRTIANCYGIPFVAGEFAFIQSGPNGFVHRDSGWSLGPYSVTYEHGHSAPSADIRRAVARRTAYWCRQATTPTPDQSMRMVIDGGQTIQLASAGRDRTGDDVVDAIYRSNRSEPVGIA